MENVSKRIKELRKKKGLSLKELAVKLGVSDTALSNIETGKTKSISIEIGKGLSNFLEIDFFTLFEIDEIRSESELVRLKELEKENDYLQKRVEDQSLLIKLLVEKNMITSPREKIIGENSFEFAGDGFLDKEIESMPTKEKEAMNLIKDNSFIRKMLEDGDIKDGLLYRVWEEHFKK